MNPKDFKPTIFRPKCPICKKRPGGDVCDNSCGTYFCCIEFHIRNGKKIRGHNRYCGEVCDICCDSNIKVKYCSKCYIYVCDECGPCKSEPHSRRVEIGMYWHPLPPDYPPVEKVTENKKEKDTTYRNTIKTPAEVEISENRNRHQILLTQLVEIHKYLKFLK